MCLQTLKRYNTSNFTDVNGLIAPFRVLVLSAVPVFRNAVH